jgi:hypothetical protein
MTKVLDAAIEVALDMLLPPKPRKPEAELLAGRAHRHRKQGMALVRRGLQMVERGEALLAEAEREEVSRFKPH